MQSTCTNCVCASCIDGCKGFSRQDVETDEKEQKALSEVLKFNIIPADPDLLAVYTEPFMNNGMRFNTLYEDGKALDFQKTNSEGSSFFGPFGSTTVQEWDKPSCKVTLVDLTSAVFDKHSNLHIVPWVERILYDSSRNAHIAHKCRQNFIQHYSLSADWVQFCPHAGHRRICYEHLSID